MVCLGNMCMDTLHKGDNDDDDNDDNNNNKYFALIMPLHDWTDDRQACWDLWGKLLTRNVPNQIYSNTY